MFYKAYNYYQVCKLPEKVLQTSMLMVVNLNGFYN